ncbi:hypothetical protein HDC93_004786 [Streptomyces sp. AK010]|nr:hypothetical protein [Streptomyces sp. AK010]
MPNDHRPTTTLWHPTGPKELDLVRDLDWRAWPPRLPEQPIFYPVLNEDYAIPTTRSCASTRCSGSRGRSGTPSRRR